MKNRTITTPTTREGKSLKKSLTSVLPKPKLSPMPRAAATKWTIKHEPSGLQLTGFTAFFAGLDVIITDFMELVGDPDEAHYDVKNKRTEEGEWR
jgi:hypothetical protein